MTVLTKLTHRTGELMRAVQFNGWRFRVLQDAERGGATMIQVEFHAPDNHGDTEAPELQTGRKWLLSPWMTDAEIVQTAFKAVLTAVEHEAREQFRYKGAAIFGPHMDLDKLVELSKRPVKRDESGFRGSEG